MTSSSRIGSIGGFVTCANSCLKVERPCLVDSTGSAESLPIEPVASSPFAAIGSRMNLMSSCVAESLLAVEQRDGGSASGLGDVPAGLVEADADRDHPLAVRLGVGERVLQFLRRR